MLRKLVLGAAITQNLALLAIFKYRSFLRANIGLLPQITENGDPLLSPAGISFYTFESLSFVFDVYRRKIEAPLRATSFFAFIGMFPRFIAGPIARYPDIARQFEDYRGMNVEAGLLTFTRGLFLKVAFADQLSFFTAYTFGDGPPSNPAHAWIGLSAFAFQLYYDFSGYSLMAIGLGECLGFSFPSNFDRPFLAESVSDFWRRWHQTLMSWFRDYLYIPLGGSRRSLPRVLLNVMITTAVCGLWHGANWTFVAWGAWCGACLCAERVFLRDRLRSRFFRHLWVLSSFWMGLVLFRSENFAQAGSVLRALLALPGPRGTDPGVFATHPLALTLSILGIAYCFCIEGRSHAFLAKPRLAGALMMGTALMLLFSSPFTPFLYFQF